MKGWAAFVNPHEFLPRDKVNANDTPFATRIVENKDANGNPDGTFHSEMRVYNNSGAALVVGQVYLLTAPATTNVGFIPQAITGAALAAVPRHYAVAVDTAANGTWTWMAIGGYVDVMVNGTTDVASGAFVKFVAGTSTTALILDHATTQSTGSWGRAQAASTADSDNLTRTYLAGDPVVWG